MAIDGIEQLIKLHQEGAPSISESDVELLPFTPFKSDPQAGWMFVEPAVPEEEPEEIKRVRERVVAYVRSKGGTAFVGKYRLSISAGKAGVEFLRRSPVKREKQAG